MPRDHAHLDKSREARWTTRVVDSGRPRSSAAAFAASSRAGHPYRHEMTRLRDVGPGDVDKMMDAISNLQQHHPTEKASPDTIDNGSTPTPTTSLHRATLGTTMDAIGNCSYTNDAATSRRRARAPSIVAQHLHRRNCRTENISPDVIEDGSASTPTTYAIRH